MEINAWTLLLTFAGSLHFDSAVSADIFMIEMSNNHNVTGVLASAKEDAFWLTTQRRKEHFQGYEVFIRTSTGIHLISASIPPKEPVPGHNPPEEFPKSAELNIWTQEMENDGIFHPYDPFAPPKLLPTRDYIFVAVAKRKKIFYALLKRKEPVNILFSAGLMNALHKFHPSGESSKRQRFV